MCRRGKTLNLLWKGAYKGLGGVFGRVFWAGGIVRFLVSFSYEERGGSVCACSVWGLLRMYAPTVGALQAIKASRKSVVEELKAYLGTGRRALLYFLLAPLVVYLAVDIYLAIGLAIGVVWGLWHAAAMRLLGHNYPQLRWAGRPSLFTTACCYARLCNGWWPWQRACFPPSYSTAR